MNVLVQLAENSGDVVLRDDIVEKVWEGRPVSDDGLSRCIRELRKVLDDDARDPKFIETVPKRGYRLIPDAEPLEEAEDSSAHSRRPSRLAMVVAAGVALLIGVLVFLGIPGAPEDREIGQGSEATRQTLAVLPLVSRSIDPEDAFIADGLHDDLLTQLAQVDAWNVISRTSVERFRGTESSVPEIAARLEATLILEGGVQRSGDRVRINVQLIDPSGDSHVWAETYDRELTVENLFEVQSEIVDSIVDELIVALDAEQSGTKTAPTTNFEAYSEYVKGRRLVRTESVTSLNAAIDHFRRAIEIDDQYAEAHAALADAYLSLATYFHGGMQAEEAVPLSEPLIARAIGLDPELAQAYVANAMLQILQNDSLAAEEAITTAIELQQSYPRAYRVFANLRWRQLRRSDAIELAEYASRLDPLSGSIQIELGRYYEAVGRYEEALSNYLTAEAVLPDNALAPIYIGALKYLVFGEVAESLTWYERAAELDPESPSMQATAALPLMELGFLEQAQAHVDRGMSLDPDVFWTRFTSMMLHIRNDERAAALEDAEAMRSIFPNQWTALRLLRDRDIEDGDPAAALARYAETNPELTEPDTPDVATYNYRAAVDLAAVYLAMGNREKARHIADSALAVMDGLSREGIFGYYLTDVSALTIRGDHEAALQRLEEAIDGGFRVRVWYTLDYDQNLEPIRDLPRFQAIREKHQRAIDLEAERARSMRAAGSE